jgi:hypothetical protein
MHPNVRHGRMMIEAPVFTFAKQFARLLCRVKNIPLDQSPWLYSYQTLTRLFCLFII